VENEQQTKPENARRLRTVVDVAGVLGCSNDTVYNLIMFSEWLRLMT
jgi:hypothetical protein